MLGNFEFDPESVPTVKLILHGFQILCVFVLWCLEIALFRDDKAEIHGNMAWPFGLAFLSILAWIYNLMTPRWDRSRRFAEPHAMLGIDVVFTILWISAFSAQAAYNTVNKCGGSCDLSKACVGLGVLTAIAWVLCIVVSMYTLQHWNNTGSLPGYDRRTLHDANIDPDKAAFSMAPHDEEAYAPVNMDDRDPGRFDNYSSNAYGGSTAYGGAGDAYDADNRYGTISPADGSIAYNRQPSVSPHPPLNVASEFDYDRRGVSPRAPTVAASDVYTLRGSSPLPPMNFGGSDLDFDPRGTSPRPVQDHDDGPIKFPAGNYDRIH